MFGLCGPKKQCGFRGGRGWFHFRHNEDTARCSHGEDGRVVPTSTGIVETIRPHFTAISKKRSAMSANGQTR
jgi:hypothetical protein